MLNIPQWMRCRMLDWRKEGYSHARIRRELRQLIEKDNEWRARRGVRTLDVQF